MSGAMVCGARTAEILEDLRQQGVAAFIGPD